MNTIIPKRENENKGFFYTVSDEQIAQYATLTIKQKLQWLYDCNSFLARVQTPKERQFMEEMKNANGDY